MRKLNITPEEMTAVCGRMVACRAADSLGITISQFYYLAQKYSLSTAFTQKAWSPQEDTLLMNLYRDGIQQKDIAKMLGRRFESIRGRVALLRKREKNMRKAA